MGSDGVMVVVVGGVGLGLLATWWARRKAAPAPTPGGSVCDALKSVDLNAYNACVVAAGLVGVIGKILPEDQLSADSFKKRSARWAAADDANKKANGAVAVPITGALRGCLGYGSSADSNGGESDVGIGDDPEYFVEPPMQGTALKFANGCVPFEGAPGWEKCQPGTTSMFAGNGRYTYWNGDDAIPKFNYQAISQSVGTGVVVGPATTVDLERDQNGLGHFYGWDRDNGMVQSSRGDPATGIIKPRLPGCAAAALTKSFPLAIPAGGTGGYKAGVPWVCPKDTLPDFASGGIDTADARDHRTAGGAVTCVPISGAYGTGYTPGTSPVFHPDPPPPIPPGAIVSPDGVTVRHH